MFLALLTLPVLIVLAAAIVIIIAMEYDQNWLSPVTLVVSGLLLYFVAGIDPIAYIVANPGLVATGLAAYVGIGLAWTVTKVCVFMIPAAKRALVEAAANFDALPVEAKIRQYVNVRPGTTEETGRAIEQARRDALTRAMMGATGRSDIPIKISNHKARIMNWLALWPCSMFWTLLNDPIRRFYQWLYECIGGKLQKFSNRAFAEFA